MEVSKAFKIIKLKRGSSSKPRFTKSDGFFHMKSLLKSLCLMVKSLFHVLYPAKKGRYNQHGVTTFCSTIWRCPKMIVAPNHPFVDRIFHEIKLVILPFILGFQMGTLWYPWLIWTPGSALHDELRVKKVTAVPGRGGEIGETQGQKETEKLLYDDHERFMGS